MEELAISGLLGTKLRLRQLFSCRPSCLELSLPHYPPLPRGLWQLGFFDFEHLSCLDESDLSVGLLDNCSVIGEGRHFDLHIVRHTTLAATTFTSLAVKVRLSFRTLVAAHGARDAVVR